MPIDLYGTLYPRLFSEVIPAQGPAFDTAHIEQRAMEHEAAGFDGVLLPHNSGWADNFLTTARAAGCCSTSSLAAVTQSNGATATTSNMTSATPVRTSTLKSSATSGQVTNRSATTAPATASRTHSLNSSPCRRQASPSPSAVRRPLPSPLPHGAPISLRSGGSRSMAQGSWPTACWTRLARWAVVRHSASPFG